MTSLTFLVMKLKKTLNMATITTTEAKYRREAGRERPPIFNFIITNESTLIRYQMKTARMRGIMSFCPIKRIKKTVTVIPNQRKERRRGDWGSGEEAIGLHDSREKVEEPKAFFE